MPTGIVPLSRMLIVRARKQTEDESGAAIPARFRDDTIFAWQRTCLALDHIPGIMPSEQPNRIL
jgi:hypothetical protein